MIEGKSVLGIIPARGGSKGVPNKNIKHLNGRPLISYTLAQAAASKFLCKSVVSTDSEEIAAVVRGLGFEVPFLRPKEIALDLSLTIDAVNHALEFFRSNGESFNYVVLLQPTTPLRPDGCIDECIRKLHFGSCDSVVTLVDVGGHHPARMYTLEEGILVSVLDEKVAMSPRQELAPVYIRSGDVYATRIETIEKYNSMLGKKNQAVIIDSRRAVNIDTALDFLVAETLASNDSLS